MLVPNGDRSEGRLLHISHCLYHNNVHFFRPLEAHIKDERLSLQTGSKDGTIGLLSSGQQYYQRQRCFLYHIPLVLVPTQIVGNGKVALFCHFVSPRWHSPSFSIFPLHHAIVIKQQQWHALSSLSSSLLPADTISLSDHKVPSSDLLPEHASIASSRDAELDFMVSLHLIDTYACFHTGRLNDFDLMGWP